MGTRIETQTEETTQADQNSEVQQDTSDMPVDTVEPTLRRSSQVRHPPERCSEQCLSVYKFLCYV